MLRYIATWLAKIDNQEVDWWIDDVTLLLKVGTLGIATLMWQHWDKLIQIIL